MSWLDWFFSWRSDGFDPQLPGPEAETPRMFRGDSFENMVSGLGTSRDLTTQSTVSRRSPQSCSALTALYRFDGYTKRFIDVVPDQATRKGWKVVSKSEEGEEPDQVLMSEEDKRLNINENVGDALRWARLYGGSVILIVNEDEDLSEPMDRDNPGEILNLAVFDRREISALSWNDDLSSPNFREVESWQLSPSMSGGSGFVGGEVHRSRVIYFPGSKLPPSVRVENMGFDDSVVEAAYDQLRNKNVLDSQMARLSHDARTRVLKLRGLDTKGLSDARDALLKRAKLIAQTINLTGVLLLLEGETFESSVDNVAGWAQLDDKSRQALSAVTAIPQSILFGDSPSGLNTDGASGRNNFGDVIAAIQNHLLRRRLEELYTILMNGPEGSQAVWALEFNPFFEVTEQETATLKKTYAETDQIYINTGVIGPDDVARSRFSDRGWEPEIRPVDLDEVNEREELEEAQLEFEPQSIGNPDDSQAKE